MIELRTRSGASLHCDLADGFVSRFLGLMGRPAPPEGRGLLLAPGGSIHTAFMRFPVDVVFIDRDGTVLGAAPSVPSWRLRRAPRRTRFVLELAGGELARLELDSGAELELIGGDWPTLGRRGHPI